MQTKQQKKISKCFNHLRRIQDMFSFVAVGFSALTLQQSDSGKWTPMKALEQVKGESVESMLEC